MDRSKVAVFWFRRDLRLDDNVGLYKALNSGLNVLPIFIFDDNILENLPEDDHRVNFIYDLLQNIDSKLKEHESSLLIKKGKPFEIWKMLVKEYTIKKVFFNKDYEPYAIKRDKKIIDFLLSNDIAVYACKDQVIFEKDEILKDDSTPYTVYTPYKNKWLSYFSSKDFKLPVQGKIEFSKFVKITSKFPTLKSVGFTVSNIKAKSYNLDVITNYDKYRNFPAKDKTSYLSPHLRFGSVSIRNIVSIASKKNPTFLNELIWREFFMQILYHFPKAVTDNFKSKYDGIEWRNDEKDFKKWKQGETGYPMVDAGMRELNKTGYMHNRVRMITASFLCKHLLIDWRWGEAYFAEKLFDYELSSNNGNWQWSAGTGCDAAPYFRIFNPETQLEKFDKKSIYVNKWIPELKDNYTKPIVEHKFARERALNVYKEGLEK